jgi:hypothetical protein
MATRIQLRRATIGDVSDSDFTGTDPAVGEPIAVYDDAAGAIPRLYIGNNASSTTNTLASHVALGGPNSVSFDQFVRDSGDTATRASNTVFADAGQGIRYLKVDNSGIASLAAVNTQSLTGNTTLAISGDLTQGDIDTGQTDHAGVLLDVAPGAIKIQQSGTGATDPAFQIYAGDQEKFNITADGDVAGVVDLTTSGTVTHSGNVKVGTEKLYINNVRVDATAAELNHLDGVSSGIQAQLNAKAALADPTFTGTPEIDEAEIATTTNNHQIATTEFVHTFGEKFGGKRVSSGFDLQSNSMESSVTGTLVQGTESTQTVTVSGIRQYSQVILEIAGRSASAGTPGSPVLRSPASQGVQAFLIHGLAGDSGFAPAVGTQQTIHGTGGGINESFVSFNYSQSDFIESTTAGQSNWYFHMYYPKSESFTFKQLNNSRNIYVYNDSGTTANTQFTQIWLGNGYRAKFQVKAYVL